VVRVSSNSADWWSMRRRNLILCAAFILGGLVGYAASLFLSKAYRSVVSATLVQSDDKSSLLAGIGSQLGGLASLVGLGATSGSDSSLAMALIRSRSLSDKFVVDAGVVEAFCERRLIKCIEGYKSDASAKAVTLRRAGKYFSQHVLSIEQDERLRVINVSITWFDRERARQWANSFVASADSELRRLAIADARSRRAYLERVAQETQVLGVQQAVYKVMESQINTEMMASTRSEYAFHIVDEAVAADPREFVRPQRAVIALVAGLLAVGAVYLFGLVRRKSAEIE
jgi:uncharacterized protein involved in exopolysaccharide biosynthesis